MANYGLNRQTSASKHLSQQALIGIPLLSGLTTVNTCQAVLPAITMGCVNEVTQGLHEGVTAGCSWHCRPSVWQDFSLWQATRHLLLRQLHNHSGDVQHGHALLAGPYLQVPHAVPCCAMLCCAVLCCARWAGLGWAGLRCAMLSCVCCAGLRCAVLCCNMHCGMLESAV